MFGRYRHSTTVLVSMLPLLLGSTVRAAPATAQADAVTIVASGLTNPRGFAWDADGTLYVALAGTGGGGETAADPASSPSTSTNGNARDTGTPVVEGAGETQLGSTTASVARIEDGCPVTVVDGLPSGGLPDLGWIFGVSDVEILDGQLYAVVDGGGAAFGNPDQPNGVYRIDADGTATLVADLSAWVRANPVSQPHEPINPDSEPFAMIAGDEQLWIVEANHQQLLTVTSDGTISRIADLSVFGNVAPSGLALAPNGGVYVSFLSPLPFTDGSAKVVQIAPDGVVSDVWTGLTAVTAVTVGEDGTLYALEMATGNLAQAPFVFPGTGKVVRQTRPGAATDVVTGMTFPAKMEFGPDGALYVAGPAFGANHDEGTIIRLDLSSSQVITMPTVDETPVDATCVP